MKKIIVLLTILSLTLSACGEDGPQSVEDACDQINDRTVECVDEFGGVSFPMGTAQCNALLQNACDPSSEELQNAVDCFNSDENLCNDTCKPFSGCASQQEQASAEDKPCPIDSFYVPNDSLPLAFVRPFETNRINHVRLKAPVHDTQNKRFGFIEFDLSARDGEIKPGEYNLVNPPSGSLCDEKVGGRCEFLLYVEDSEKTPVVSADLIEGSITIFSVEKDENDSIQSIDGRLSGLVFDTSTLELSGRALSVDYSRYISCNQSEMKRVTF